jgi:hypothetical protein
MGRPPIFFRTGLIGERKMDKIFGTGFWSEFTDAFVTPGTPEYKQMEHAVSERDRNQLRALRLLRYVCVGNNETAARKALKDAGQLLFSKPDDVELYVGGKNPQKVAIERYRSDFNEEIHGHRIVIRRSKRGEFIPAIHCTDMKTAMFLYAAFRGVEACLNCGRLFAVDAARPDASSSDRYCTARCGQSYRQKLYRTRIKKASEHKARKHA